MAATVVAAAAGTAHATCGPNSAFGLAASLGPVDTGQVALSRYPAGPAKNAVGEVSLGQFGKVMGVSSSATGSVAKGTRATAAKIVSARLNLLTASLTTDAVTSKCTAKPGSGPTGSVKILEASVKAMGGAEAVELPASPAPNTKVALPGVGEVVLNEQIKNRDGSLTVNAMRLQVAPLDGTVVIASATCKAGTPGKADPTTGTGNNPPSDTGPGGGDTAPATGSVTGTSVDSAGKPVAGTTLRLDNPDGADPTCTTNAQGQCTFPKLKANSYRLCVTDAPDGYTLPKATCKGPIKVTDKNVKVKFTLPKVTPAPSPATGSVTGVSVDRDGQRIGGVVFQLKTPVGADPSCTTSSSKGSCTFPKLKADTYRLCVIDVADGYSLPKTPCRSVTVKDKNVNATFTIPAELGKKG